MRIASLPGRPYRPPLRRAFDLVRRGGFMPARAAPPELPGFRFTTFGGSTAGIEGVFGRIYNPPLHARATISCCRGVQNTYSLTQKNPTCICKSVFLCWRYLSSCVGKVLSRRRRDQKLFVVHINEQRLAADKSLFSCWRYLSSRVGKVLSQRSWDQNFIS